VSVHPLLPAEAGHQAHEWNFSGTQSQHANACVCPLLLLCLQKLDIKLMGISLVLCNDKHSSFGAPDVLQFCADGVDLNYQSNLM
jgi:hypothetical protein